MPAGGIWLQLDAWILLLGASTIDDDRGVSLAHLDASWPVPSMVHLGILELYANVFG